MGRMHALGDYVLDDEFDDSYESLLALEQMNGPVKKGCSTDVLNQLPSGTFEKLVGDSKKALTEEERCSVCLDEYEKQQMCTRLPKCSHVYHKECIEGWLKTANTCPVCREVVEGVSRPERTATLSARRGLTLARARQYLREASGPSASGPAVSNPQGPRRGRRRSTNESQTSAPPVRDLVIEGPSSGNSRRERARRAANVGMLSIDTSSLGSSSGPTSLHRRYESEILDPYSPVTSRTNPSPLRQHPEAPGRFTRGPFARLLSRDSEVDNFSRHF